MATKSDLIIMAGPCSVEDEDMIRRLAEVANNAGAQYLRGGAFKPRTKAGEWTGHGEVALGWMRKAANEFGLKIVTEILGEKDISMFKNYGVDLYQVGARNAQNQDLLIALGKAEVPVLLKNGMNTSLKEWLGSAGKAGEENRVMLCARGKNVDTDVARNEQGMTTLVKLVNDTSYKIIFDPSHSSGKRELVYGVTIGAIAMGVHGIEVEVHHDPIVARTDGRQSITPRQLEYLVRGAHQQRNFYLEQQKLRQGFQDSTIPAHADIYFRSVDLPKIQQLIKGVQVGHYSNSDSGILTSRVPVGSIGVFRHEGCAIGELVHYSVKAGDSSAEAIHIAMPIHNRLKIKMTPYNSEALSHRGSHDSLWEGKRVEFAHGFAGQPIKDAYLTIDMGRVPELIDVPLIIYKPIKE